MDVALFQWEHLTDFEMVVRNENGHFVACRSSLYQGCVKTRGREAMKLTEALSWIHKLRI